MRIIKAVPPRTAKESHAVRDQRRAKARQRICKWNGHTYIARNSRGNYCPDHVPERKRSSGLGQPSLFVCLDGEGMTGKCLEVDCPCPLFIHLCEGSESVCRTRGRHEYCITCPHIKSPQERHGTGGHEHKYVLLGVGKAQLWHEDARELHWPEIFDFLYRQFLSYPRRAAFVGFFLGYDFNNWLKGLPWDRAAALLLPDDKNYKARRKTRSDRRGGNNEPFPVQVKAPENMSCPIRIRDGGTVWQWQIDMLGNHKRFKLRPQPCACQLSNCPHVRGIPYMYICDVAPFFQRSFMSVINPHNWATPIVTDEEWQTLDEGKGKRDHAVLDEDMRYYNMLENEVLARVMTRLDEGFRATGVELSRKQWFGPGQPAGVWLSSRAPKRKDLWPTLPDGLMYAAQCTYIAGWWDIFAHGHMPPETHLYDINSAYPYQIARLPCMGRYQGGQWIAHGNWRYTRHEPALYASVLPRIKDGIAMVYALVEGSNPYIGAMLHREKNGSICRPHATTGWFWIDELNMAMDAGLVDEARIFQSWVHIPDCECPPPLREVSQMYNKRLEVGKDTPLGIGAKLNYNSQSGKFAQTVGENPPFLNWIYASRITSGCRTQILEAIATHPIGARSALMIATDAVLFLDEHPGLSISNKLGDWSHNVKHHVTLAKPGFWWDQSARDALAEGKSPSVKSRGISAGAFAAAMQTVDRQFEGWRGPDECGWPEITFRLGFNMLTLKQALRQNRWEDAAKISTPEVTLSMASNMLVKRDPGWFDEHYGIYRSVPKLRDESDLLSYPYEPKNGPAQLEADGLRDAESLGITDDGTWQSQIAEAMQLKD